MWGAPFYLFAYDIFLRTVVARRRSATRVRHQGAVAGQRHSASSAESEALRERFNAVTRDKQRGLTPAPIALRIDVWPAGGTQEVAR
jgi:hypothetical protein